LLGDRIERRAVVGVVGCCGLYAASVSDKTGAKLLLIRLFDAFSRLKII
jgi:hypothetical protein